LRALLISDPWILAWTALMGLLSFLASFFDRTGVTQHRMARVWARWLLRGAGVRVQTRGLEQIDPTGSYVFAANHASYLDTPAILANIPVEFRFLAKRELFKIPAIGTHLDRAGHIPVDRDDPRASVRTMTEAARIIRERGISVLIFPEGGRSADGELKDFRDGAAYIAIKAGVPLVPVAIAGTHRLLPPGSALVKAGAAFVHIGQPIPVHAFTLKDRAALTRRAQEAVAELLGRSRTEAQQPR
jgi:1-acyl-sn-glycerol-3-phosphate acyltransferase